jgi:hypothetical protein
VIACYATTCSLDSFAFLTVRGFERIRRRGSLRRDGVSRDHPGLRLTRARRKIAAAVCRKPLWMLQREAECRQSMRARVSVATPPHLVSIPSRDSRGERHAVVRGRKHRMDETVLRVRDGRLDSAGPSVLSAPVETPASAFAPTGDQLNGLVERVTFFSEESGFCVLRVKAEGHRDLVTVVGSAASVSAGEWIAAEGEWVIDKEHGRPKRRASKRRRFTACSKCNREPGVSPAGRTTRSTAIFRRSGSGQDNSDPFAVDDRAGEEGSLSAGGAHGPRRLLGG